MLTEDVIIRLATVITTSDLGVHQGYHGATVPVELQSRDQDARLRIALRHPRAAAFRGSAVYETLVQELPWGL